MSYAGKLAKQIELAKAREKKIDDLRIAVIKGHLLVEETLDRFLLTALFNPNHLNLDRMNFHLKVGLALALALKEDKDKLWDVLWAVNQLRNKIAHDLDSNEINQKMAFLRKEYIDALESAQKADAEKLSEIELVKEACWLLSGLLAQLTEDARGWRATIDKGWKARSEMK